MITVLTWFWSQPGGRTQYAPFHVNIWADQVSRHLKQPHKIACVTNQPEGLDPSIEIIEPPREFEDIRIPSWVEARPQCLRRLVMFRKDAGEIFGERFACLDLDCVIGGPLDPFFDTDADFKMAQGTAPDRPYNGSMMMLRAGTRPQVYDQFTAEGAAKAGKLFVGSDQAWIAHILGPNEETWGKTDGLVWFGKKKFDNTSLMFFPGWEKPWEVARTPFDPWINQHYRREPQGRALILGYGETLWSDVDWALDHAPYDAVIASPEAAEHWPGEILEIANTNDSAAKIAKMHGLEPTWCGVREMEAA